MLLCNILLHKANFIVFVSILFIYRFGGHYWQNILFSETPWWKTTNEREFPGVALRGSIFAAVIDPFPMVPAVQRMVWPLTTGFLLFNGIIDHYFIIMCKPPSKQPKGLISLIIILKHFSNSRWSIYQWTEKKKSRW